VRLALEDAAADYVDVARMSADDGMGVPALMRLLEAEGLEHPPFAPPFLKAADMLIGQTANILLYLGPRIGLGPKTERDRHWAHQLQLTVADLVAEVHDTHHPIASGLYYEDQKPEALRRAADFTRNRLPKYLRHFERARAANGFHSGYLVGNALSCADLSLFQVIEGLRYAFPQAMARVEPTFPGLLELHARVAARPRIAAYLASPRRLPFSEEGIFRHYPELDR